MCLTQDYIARFGHGSAKLARQAQSKEKVLAKMVAGGLAEKLVADKVMQCLHSNAVPVQICHYIHALKSSNHFLQSVYSG